MKQAERIEWPPPARCAFAVKPPPCAVTEGSPQLWEVAVLQPKAGFFHLIAEPGTSFEIYYIGAPGIVVDTETLS